MRVVVVAAVLVAASRAAFAQGLTRCELNAPGGASSEIVNGREIARGGGGIRVNCPSRNLRLAADSGEIFGEERVELYGHVHYDEPTRIDLLSDRLTYFQADERVLVRGHVIATLPSGSRLNGPEATLLRDVPRVRRIQELTAPGGPTVTIAGRDTNEKPVVVTANTIYMRGDSLTYASRNVVIDRQDLVATADSAFMDGRVNSETMRLMFKPSVEGREGRKFKLEGDVIDAYSKDRKLQRVIARGKGHATSKDLEIHADTLELRMANDALERAIAWNRQGQAKATAPGQVITADSIDVSMPGQKVRVVYAVRNARAEADADTVRYRTTERDWLRGDVLTAWFDSTATKDTSRTPPLDRVITTHHADSAQAYYHMAASNTSCHEPAISYVRGREILIDFDNRKVGVVSVRDSVVGMYLEPKCLSAKDSAAAKTAKSAKPGTKTTAKPPAKPPIKKPPAARNPQPVVRQ